MQHNLIGRTIGSYYLLETLGAGGMASVYRARRTADNRQVAIKVLPIHLAANDTLRQRFMREAQMAARLEHPHILPVHDFGEDAGTPYIVMKLVDGGTLADLIQHEGKLPLPVIARILAQVAQALDHAHAQGVIHRDLKPENILFDANSHAYLADFGIARLNETSTNLTGSGGFLGTAAYASPEQCRGEDLTPTSDIYSLGVVLYEMLTGTLPFEGSTPLAIIHQHISEPPPNPLKHRPELPVEIIDVLRKALAKLPSVRYQSASAMSRALNTELRRALGTQPLVEDAPPIGPDPVFDKPTNAYAPSRIPEQLLREIAPTKPSPPSARRIAHQPPAPAPPSAPASNHAALYFYLTLLAIFVMIAIIIVVAIVS